MPCFTVALDPSVEMFYRRIAAQAELPLESVLSDALFKLAGELSLEAISRKAARREKSAGFRIKPAKAPLFFLPFFAILYPKRFPANYLRKEIWYLP